MPSTIAIAALDRDDVRADDRRAVRRPPDYVVRPITRFRFTDLERLFSTSSIANSCWDMWIRRSPADDREIVRQGMRHSKETNREGFRALAARRRAPGLLAYDGRDAVGFASLGPRTDMRRVEASQTTPRVDDVAVWVVPCLYVHPRHRGRGVTVALLRAAVDYACRHGAPAVEGYPRAPGSRVSDDAAFFGSMEMFRRAGYRTVRRPPADLRKGWVPRYTMRAVCAP